MTATELRLSMSIGANGTIDTDGTDGTNGTDGADGLRPAFCPAFSSGRRKWTTLCDIDRDRLALISLSMRMHAAVGGIGMSEHFDVIVLGLGAMGSAAVYQLAKGGVKVLGIDRFSPPHTLGSTHGDSRITRQAIGEGEHYSPLSLHSYELFREVEKLTGSKFLEITGGLIISSDSDHASINNVDEFFENTLSAAKKYDIKHEMLDSKDMRKRFPQFKVADNEIGYFEHEAGFLRPELAVQAHLKLAADFGANIHTNEIVVSFEETSDGVEVRTDHNEIYRAAKLVISAGPWLPQLLAHSEVGVDDIAEVFTVFRQVLFWFDVSAAHSEFTQEKFPVFIWHLQGRDGGIYGFPSIDGPSGGIKIASESYVNPVTPDSVRRDVEPNEIIDMYENKVRPFFPKVAGKCVKSAVCLYTVTADSGFVLDWFPSSQRVLLCSPCSGHGFKHSAAIGEAVAQLVTDRKTTLDLSPMNLQRLRKKTASKI